MTVEIALMLLLVGLGLVAFAREAFPMEVTALGMMAAVFLLGFVDTKEAFSGFSSKAVITIGALFVLGHALLHAGLLDAAAEWLGDRLGRPAVAGNWRSLARCGSNVGLP